ncbi:hypothetical protein [Pyxidicoccus sp. MSG2]|uniref:hypothetical protein n=1 Tax=Pyxidicoccus sp. MSG2 TaxID=2996790 RepID=UPI00226E2D30|nr:hypothetical protein [Pyxidicoccus sp. MSG2]MCY1014563.1 hypothetical protein [Pyxidicoccus sp. MSG2]
MGSSIGQSIFRAVKDTFSKPAGSAPSTAAKNATASAPDAPWRNTANNLLKGLVGAGFVKGLSESQFESLQNKITQEMESFVRDNPKATPEKLDEQAKTITMRHASMARFDKQREQKLKERLEELKKDRWG